MNKFLGCDYNPQLKDLCDDIEIDSMFELEDKVYVFRVDKYWVFKTNVNKEKPLGPLIEGNIKISDKWKGMDANDYRFTIRDNKIVAISYEKWNVLESNGEIIKSEDIEPEKSNQETNPEVSEIINVIDENIL